MKHLQRWTRTVLITLTAAVITSFLWPSAAVAASPDPAVVASFQSLLTYIDGIPSDVLSNGNKTSFRQRVENSLSQYSAGKVCAAANMLTAHLNESQALRKRNQAVSEELYARGRALRSMVVRSALPPDPCAEAAIGRAPEVVTVASDEQHFAGRITFGAPILNSVRAGGETWTQVSLPQIDNLIGAPGMPAVPSWQALIGVPHGATVSLPAVQSTRRETLLVNLYPYQQSAIDPTAVEEPPPREIFNDPPFVKNTRVYATSAFLPPNPCAVKILGETRDLQVAQIECNAAQYNPVTDELVLFDSINFDVQFVGGDGTFITSRMVSLFEQGNTIDLMLNRVAIRDRVRPLGVTPSICYGEELLILTHPDFRPAADALAQWKRDKGIVTTVREVGVSTLTSTPAQIDALIENRYNTCLLRPSYVLLIGDSEFIPPSIPSSDFGYATLGAGTLPFFAVSRIPVDTLAEAQTVVNKTIGYEHTPPFLGLLDGAPFYTSALNASYFQCCSGDAADGRDQRTFVQTSETVRDTLLANGYSVDRVYTNSGAGTPKIYNNGTALPAELAPGTFLWAGTTTDIVNALNAGRFVALHRDHGWYGGWADPVFNIGNLSSLTNGALLPFVYSVNCSSGYWDREANGGGTTESFMEEMLMLPTGGMVAGIGDTRDSPTWPNSALTRGYYDATWPDLAPEFGAATSQRRLGDILNHGKLYLFSQIGVAQPAGSIAMGDYTFEANIWHAFGDPTAEMWTRNPHRIKLPTGYELFIEKDHLLVKYPFNGATITAMQEIEGVTIPIGRGIDENGYAIIPFLVQPNLRQPIMLTASFPNAVSVVLAGANPDLIVSDLVLESTTLTVGQNLSSLKVLVKNQGGMVALGTIAPDGSLSGTGYMIDLVLSSDTLMPTGFASVPLPPGVAYAEDGLLQGGRISRTTDVAAGATIELTAGVSDVGGVIPLQAPTGPQFLCARIDPGDAISESDESNNVTCVAVTVVPDIR